MNEPSLFDRAMAEVAKALQNAENGARLAARISDDSTTADALRAVVAVHIGDAMEQIQAIINRGAHRRQLDVGQQIDIAEPSEESVLLTELAAKLGGGLIIGKC